MLRTARAMLPAVMLQRCGNVSISHVFILPALPMLANENGGVNPMAGVASSAPPLADAPLSRFLRVEDPALARIGDALWDLKQAIALQCVYITGACHRARAANAGSSTSASAVTIGIVGGGVMGGVVAHALLDAGTPPSAVMMSTRSPQRQKDLAARGVAVVFDNALVASRAQLLIIAVLPAQLQELARTLRPGPRTLVLSLVGATPASRIRMLFNAPTAITSAAEATLPLIEATQAVQQQRSTSKGTTADQAGPLAAGRLVDDALVEVAARGLAPDRPIVKRLMSALRNLLSEFELPLTIANKRIDLALFGEISSDVARAIREDLEGVDEAPPPARAAGAAPMDPLEDQAWDSEAAHRLRRAFMLRIRGDRVDEGA